ncbi:hypothetical protein EFK50_07330 [Nocardioides marmoriginsengisoli]|uniref:Uncharacterized protein n=1 Tax=Nocardioides marmoriginsengisoli TaxID=661483 RepID=A0A3N0CM10_9ACTN|nr:hypothetical protein [Nocardioides marmoriginsengisoli]RNL64331.1 hypothetical protein EFK50_07330 [Nocardioides marmoriginsengisoli]
MNRWTGGIFLLPLAALNVYVLCAFGAPWPGQWMWTIDSVTGGTVLTAPLTAAFAAWIALGQTRMAELTDSTLRGRLVLLLSAQRAWLWSAALYLTAAVGAALVTLAVPHGGPAPWWAALIGPLVLAVGALLGVLAIRLWQHPMAAVLVGPTVFVFGAFGPHPYAALLRPGPTTGSLAGLVYDPRTWAVQMILLILICLALAFGVLVRTPLSWSGVLLGGVSVTVVIFGATLGSTHHQRFEASGERPDACVGTAPRICLSPSERRALSATATTMRTGIEELREIGVDLPTRYEELLPGYRPPVTAGMIDAVEGDARLRLGTGLRNVATPAACPAWTDPRQAPPDGAFDGRDLIVDWLLVRTGHDPVASEPEARRWLAEADGEAATSWVSATFGQLRSCAFDRISLPWTQPTR